MNVAANDPRTYLTALWRWKFLFLLFVLACPAIAYAVSSREAKVYQSSVLITENPSAVDTSLFASGTTSSVSIAPSPVTLSGEARVIETPAVARLAATHLNPAPASPSSLLARIHATADASTGFITITARASSPLRAAQIANAFGAGVVTLRNQQAIALLTGTINHIVAQIALARADRAGERPQLSTQLQRLRALRGAQNNAQILQSATVNRSAVSPQTVKVVGLGLLGGLLLGVTAVFLAEAADRRLRRPEDLEQLTGLPMLAVIPSSAFSSRPGKGQTDNSFHMLCSALGFYNANRQSATIMIASPRNADGKTMVATQLAYAAAQTGRDVILVDTDLRNPQAASASGSAISAPPPRRG